ncbi:MAG: M14 family zinc carboxypeptidase [Ferruginibacter sp.]
MRTKILLPVFILISYYSNAQQCRFEISNGKQSATYFEAVNWYKDLDRSSAMISVKEMGPTDAGYPLHLVMLSSDAKFDPVKWHQQKKAVILVNNGIHPGEPDGIDASMMLVRDLAKGKIKLPNNIVIAFIPVYNIGGCLNRGTSSRVNQNGPEEYGFRGNSENLDLNRDFTKCDSKEARTFTEIFHFLDPDILIDNHVSDGADYQYTMTMLTTQYDKLGADLGGWLKDTFEPQLFSGMKEKNWEMTPYVNFETADFDKGMEMFYDPPRYSSGYAALFGSIGFIPETHMLKPYTDRVKSTYAFMQTMIEKVSLNATALLMQRSHAKMELMKEHSYPLSWDTDSSKSGNLSFKGYETGHKTSEATGLQRIYYDHSKPYEKSIKYFNVFKPMNIVTAPKAYVIPHGWQNVTDLLKLNGVIMQQLKTDTSIEVTAYHIDDYKTLPRPYEKHHKNSSVKVSASVQTVKFLKGDYLILLNQFANRYIVEMLEPTGDDSFFAWNFFDAILQQKEGYSDYRWEDIAAVVLKNNPALKEKLEAKKKEDARFAASGPAQLDFIYKNSVYYEPAHLRYPVYRIN